MNLIISPSLNTPIIIRNIPAIIVATIRPSIPYWSMIPQIITTKAAVGPPI